MTLSSKPFLFFFLLLWGATAAACAPEPTTPAAPPQSSYTLDQVTFTDVAQEVGIDFVHSAFRWEVSGDPIAMMGGGLCWLDYDNDGWLDLYVVNSYAQAEAGRWESEVGSLPRSALYRNTGGQFEDVSSASGSDLVVRGNGCVAADFDLDGDSDIYITTSRVNKLLWNNGNGTFTEGGAQAGVDAYGWQTATAVGDLNQDGWPDLFVAGYVDINNRIEGATMGFPNTHVARQDLLFLSNGRSAAGEVTFREVGSAVGLETEALEYGLGAVFSDFDQDGDLDLFVANDTNPNRLYLNATLENDPQQIGFRLIEVGGDAQINDTNSGMGVAGGDYDNDGQSDLFITNMGEQFHSVYQNSFVADQRFSDAKESLGLAEFGVGWTGWGTTWADFDLDTDLDLIVANGGIPVTNIVDDGQLVTLYLNQTAQGEQGLFDDGTSAARLEALGPILARGSAVADYDNDGDLDVAIGTIGEPLRLLRNDIGSGNWLHVDLDRYAPGARVTAVLPDGTQLVREVHTGSSYLSSEEPRCHFGLAGVTQLPELRVTWPDGEETILTDVPTNQVLRVDRP